MNKEDRRLLDQHGFVEDRSFYHSWSKETERFQIFADTKKQAYFSISLIDEDEKGIKCQVDLMFEVEGSENFDDYSTVHMFTIRRKTISDAISSSYSLMKNIGNGLMSSLGKCVI